MAIPLVVAGAAVAFKAWNQYQAGQAEAGALRDQAMAKKIQADGVIKRFELNSKMQRLEGEVFKGQQLGVLAKSGVDIGQGMSLSALEDTQKRIDRRIDLDRIEAEAQADAIRMGADLDKKQARQSERMGERNAMASVLGGAAGMF